MVCGLDTRTAIAGILSPADASIRAIASTLFLLSDSPAAAPLAATLHWRLHGERAATILWRLHRLHPPECGACSDPLPLLTALAAGVPRGLHLLKSDAGWALSTCREAIATWSLPWFDVSRCFRAASILACLESHASRGALLAAAGHNALAGHRPIWCDYCTTALTDGEAEASQHVAGMTTLRGR